MSLYIHHVPGRLRVRAQAFRCEPGRAEAAARKLTDQAGIERVSINARAGSITVHYDPAQRSQGELLAMLEGLGCVGSGRALTARDTPIGDLFGKALLGALAQTVAQRSVQGLVGALL